MILDFTPRGQKVKILTAHALTKTHNLMMDLDYIEYPESEYD
jgi:hypothetical protein